jgi:hypothetical protein
MVLFVTVLVQLVGYLSELGGKISKSNLLAEVFLLIKVFLGHLTSVHIKFFFEKKKKFYYFFLLLQIISNLEIQVLNVIPRLRRSRTSSFRI